MRSTHSTAMPWVMLWALFLILPVSLSSCLSLTKRDLAAAEDYVEVREALQKNHPNEALSNFTNKEDGGFITTLEKGWLSLLAGTPRVEELRKASASIDERKTLSISSNLGSFFYKETEDAYYPSEHEVIVFHLITATAYLDLDQKDAALVELRKATFYLQAHYDHDLPPFDDGGLRLWSAGLWTACGDWSNARVDLRVAAKLLKNRDLARLAAKKSPPPYSALIFAGVGPEVLQDEDALSQIRFPPSIRFDAGDLRFAGASGGKPKAIARTNGFYARHQERNRLIESTISESAYMANASNYAVAAGLSYSAGSAVSVLLVTGGLVTGVAFLVGGVYLSIITGVGDLAGAGAALGLLVGGKMISAGMEQQKRTRGFSEGMLKKGLDRAQYYRYARFIPDLIVYDWRDASEKKFNEKEDGPILVGKKRKIQPFMSSSAKGGAAQLQIFYVPAK